MHVFRTICAAGLSVLLAGLASAELTLSPQATFRPDEFGGYPTSHVVVQVQPGQHPLQGAAAANGEYFADGQVNEALRRFGVTGVRPVVAFPFGNPELAAQIGLDRYYLVQVPPGSNVTGLVVALQRFGATFSRVELDGIGGVADTIPNDTDFAGLYGMHNTGQNTCAGIGTPDADIDAPGAWDMWTGESNITLAVIDSGVQNHVDFGNKVLVGWNTVTNSTEVSDVSCPHGTHVAGTAAAIGNNALGVAGVSWGALILPVKVLTGCGGNETDCGEGIIWAADNGADVGTMSLQYYQGIQFFKDAVEYGHMQGMVLIAATGNNQGNVVAYPARFPFCMGVGATTNDDEHAGFSNYGPECDISAPGQDVWSTLQVDSYACYSGTSMATPHTSGLACLLWSFNPGLSNDQVIQALIDNVDDLGTPGHDQFFGWGRINAQRTLQNNVPGLLVSVVGSVPAVVPPGQTADFTVKVSPGPDTLIPGTEKLHYRVNGGAFVEYALVPQGGELYTATLPAADCNDVPEYYVSAEGQTSGVRTAPFNAPAELFSTQIGTLTDVITYTQTFANGLPAGWTKTGLWNITDQCAVEGSCDGGKFAYYGQFPTCTYNFTNLSGTLTTAPLPAPLAPPGGLVRVRFCYTLETENLPGEDQAFVQINGVDVFELAESADVWTTEEVDITALAGSNVRVGFRFANVGAVNPYRGLQVDAIQFLTQEVSCSGGCAGDVDGDGDTDQADLGILISNYGQTVPPNTGGDLDGDGDVDQSDLGVLVSAYGCQ